MVIAMIFSQVVTPTPMSPRAHALPGVVVAPITTEATASTRRPMSSDTRTLWLGIHRLK